MKFKKKKISCLLFEVFKCVVIMHMILVWCNPKIRVQIYYVNKIL